MLQDSLTRVSKTIYNALPRYNTLVALACQAHQATSFAQCFFAARRSFLRLLAFGCLHLK
jgi:hypothetical protein